MTLLDSNLTTQLAGLLEKMVNPINLVAYVDSSENSQKVIELLQEVANQSNKITVIKDDKSSTKRIPSFSITNPQNNVSVSFAGLPLGHEFSSLVLAILQVSGYAPKISDEQRKAILQLGSHDITTYMSVTCINCPEVVQSLNTISIINPKVKHIAVEGSAFKDEVDALGVMSVPAVFENGKMISSGRSSIDELVAILLRQEENGDSSDSSDSTVSGDSSLAQKMNAKNPYDVLIVGGGPAASAAAIYTARKGLKTAMIMDHRGGQVVETESIENHISQNAHNRRKAG